MTQQLLLPVVADVPERHTYRYMTSRILEIGVRLGNTRHIISTYLSEPLKLKDPCPRAASPTAQCDTGEDLGRSLDDDHLKGKVVMLGPEHRKLAHGATTMSMRVGSLPVLTIVNTVRAGCSRRNMLSAVWKSEVWNGEVVGGNERRLLYYPPCLSTKLHSFGAALAWCFFVSFFSNGGPSSL